MGDVIAANGPRTPAWDGETRTFDTLVVGFYVQGDRPSKALKKGIAGIRRAYDKHLRQATLGRARLHCAPRGAGLTCRASGPHDLGRRVVSGRGAAGTRDPAWVAATTSEAQMVRRSTFTGACMVAMLMAQTGLARSQEAQTPAGFAPAWQAVGVNSADKFDATSSTSSIDGAWAGEVPLGPLAGTTAIVGCEVAFFPTTPLSVCGAGKVQFTLKVAGRKVLRRSDTFLATFCDNAAAVAEEVDLSDFEPTDILSCTAKVKTGGAVAFVDGGAVYVRTEVGRLELFDARPPHEQPR